jgi:hypothetical protein
MNEQPPVAVMATGGFMVKKALCAVFFRFWCLNYEATILIKMIANGIIELRILR